VPENDISQPRRTIELDPDAIARPDRAPFVELGLASCFSFLRGASDAVDLVLTAGDTLAALPRTTRFEEAA